MDIQYYIASGAKNAQYTLRQTYHEHTADGVKVRDVYLRNLGIDRERALAEAAAIAGQIVHISVDSLNPYGQKTEAEVERELRAAEYAARDAAQKAEAAERIRKRREIDALSQHQGTIGERITRDLQCLKWIPLGENAYGVMRYVALFSDDSNHRYVFFGNSTSLPNAGETKKITFTVGAHTERDGCKQTVIKQPRCK